MTDTSYLYSYFLDKTIDNDKKTAKPSKKEEVKKPIEKSIREVKEHE